MKVRPLGSRVLIERTPPESMSSGEHGTALIIPSVAQEHRAEGTILAVGRGDRDRDGTRIPPDVSVGDRVIFSRHHGTNTTIGGQELVIIPSGDIHAVLE